MLARITVEILGAIPITELEVSTTVERPGRSVELLAGELRAGDKPVLRARAWRVLGSPVSTPAEPPAALPEEATPPPPLLGEAFGYAHAIEWRWARGGWEERGPATVWTRMRIPLVEGEEPTPRQRVMVVADSGNGASNVLDWTRYLFINTELTVHFTHEPVGEWVLLDARTADRRGRRGAGQLGAQRPLGRRRSRRAGAVRGAAFLKGSSFRKAPARRRSRARAKDQGTVPRFTTALSGAPSRPSRAARRPPAASR